jgi:PKD repeat protein
MNKQPIVSCIVIILLVIGLSGCVEQKQENIYPTLEISVTPANPEVDSIVEFFSNPEDEDGTIVSYFWEFGDGSKSNESNPTHSYHWKGTYLVTCDITDDRGGVASDFIYLTVIEKTE